MRGKGECIWEPLERERITPAYAGKSLPKDGTAKKAEDHPRLCGEKKAVQKQRGTNAGSPPPMRGKGQLCKRHVLGGGITPAYAGKSGDR